LILGWPHHDDNGLDYDAAFPNVQRIGAYCEFENRKFIQNNFPNLTHLQIDQSKQRKFHYTEIEIVEILRNIPTVSHLGIHYCTPNILRRINENFTNIMDLGIIKLGSEFKYNTEPIRMEYIEKFMFEGKIDFDVSAFIKFKHLKELKWYSNSHPELLLLDIISDCKHSLEIIEVTDTIIRDEHLSKINNLDKLQQFSFRFDPKTESSFTAEGILTFIKSNRKLKEIRLLEARQKLRQELYTNFKSSKLFGKLETFDPNSDENGDIYIIMHPNHRRNLLKNDNFFSANTYNYEK